MNGTLLALGAALAFLTVALGAFGAHAIRGRIPDERLAVYQTGVQYQMFHALAILATGILRAIRPHAPWGWAAGLFVAGTVLFSGSLYALALSGRKRLGAITPVGGAAFLAGWVVFLIAALQA